AASPSAPGAGGAAGAPVKPRGGTGGRKTPAAGREVPAARTGGMGRARRFSATLKIDMLYLAVPVHHPTVAFVRVALPLTGVPGEVQAVLSATVVALSLALVGAGAIAWILSARISGRVRLIARVAERYRRGDLAPAQLAFGDDELGTVARALDDAVQEIGRRLTVHARGQAPLHAIPAAPP